MEYVCKYKKWSLSKTNFYISKKKKFCENFLKILWDEGFILGYKLESKNQNMLKIFLKYKNFII